MDKAVQVFTQGNTIFLYGIIGDKPAQVDEKMADKFISDLGFIKALSEIQLAFGDAAIRVNCYGGSVLYGSAMITAIQKCPKPPHIYVDGAAFSMAFNLLMSVPRENRHMGNAATLMCHEIRSSTDSMTPAEMIQYAVGLQTMRDGTVQRMADEMGLSKEVILERYFDGKDHYFSYQEAIALGLVADDDTESNYDTAEIVQQSFAFPTGPDEVDDEIFMLNRFQAARAVAIQQFSNQQKIEEKMTKEQLQEAFQKGELDIATVEAILQAEKAKQPVTQEAINIAVQAAIQPLQEAIAKLSMAAPNSNPAAPNGTDGNGGFQGEKTPQQLAEEKVQQVEDIIAKDGVNFDSL